MKYSMGIGRYHVEIDVRQENELDHEYMQGVLQMYATFAEQQLNSPPEVQMEIMRRVRKFGRSLIHDVETGKLKRDAAKNDGLDALAGGN